MKKTVTIQDITNKKGREPIVMVTSYDFTMTRIIDETDIDIILVGDSAGVVIAGDKNTLSVTMDQMIYHTMCVTKAEPNALVVGDMPFLSYQSSVEKAILNAGRFLQEGKAQAIKIEGGQRIIEHVKAIVAADIPVMGHLGLTPQSIHAFGGYKVQGRGEKSARKIIEDALRLQDAGVFSLVLECVPVDVGKEITEKLDIPTIGIGAGPFCDGQVLVIQDLLGMFKEFKPKFVKHYANLFDVIKHALDNYAKEVRKGLFPDIEHSFRR